MSQITILDPANVPMGPFTREQVADKLQRGEVTLSSLAFVEGLSQWTPLRDVMARLESKAPALPVPPAAPVPPVTRPPATSSAAVYSYAATMQPPAHFVYAGFWLRFVAHFIDSLIVGLPIGLLFVVVALLLGGVAAAAGGFNADSSRSDAANSALAGGFVLLYLVVFAGCVVIGWLYSALLESGKARATYGKRLMGLSVTTMAGERLTFAHASGRFFGKIVTGMIPFGVGYMMAGFTERKQALHDMIAGTLVIRN
jgi:uncharacterized RDD family membrane protein YckC